MSTCKQCAEYRIVLRRIVGIVKATATMNPKLAIALKDCQTEAEHALYPATPSAKPTDGPFKPEDYPLKRKEKT